MDSQIVDSDAMLPNRNFAKSVDAEMILFQRACIANPGKLACIIRDMIAILTNLRREPGISPGFKYRPTIIIR